MTETAKAGELESLGFEEVEPGIIHDTPENRRRVRQLGGEEPWSYDQILDEDGYPVGLIKPVSPAMRTQLRMARYDEMKPYLVKQSDRWSDYVGPDNWPMDARGAPWWVGARMRSWQDRVDEGRDPTKIKPYPIRCETIRFDGTRCWSWAGNPRQSRHCSAHGNYNPELDLKKQQLGKIKMIEAAPRAADILLDLAESAVSENVRLGAANSIMDRAGIRGGTELDITGEITVEQTAALSVREKLSAIQDRAAETKALLEPPPSTEPVTGDIVEAELVEHDTD